MHRRKCREEIERLEAGVSREAEALSKRDRLTLIEALLNSPEPNARLRKAMQRHDRLVRSSPE